VLVLERDRRRSPTLVSLFTGAGGLDVGLERAGFRTVSAIDNDLRCIEVLRENQARRIQGRPGTFLLAGTKLVHASVADVQASDLASSRGDGRPDLLAGGPPCQPFSSAGKQLSLDDPRGRLFEHFVRLTRALAPRYILFENVRGLVTARGANGEPGEVIHAIRAAFEDLGYGTRFGLLNAADYGCPQRRVRVFMLAAARGEVPAFPPPTHARVAGAGTAVQPWVTLGDFLAGRPAPTEDEVVRPSPRLAAALAEVPDGSGLKSPGAREATRPGGHWGYKQGTFIADPRLPARTVTAAATQDWVRDEQGRLRRLTLSECAALQGFPPEWRFSCPRADAFRQVGNAVPAVFGTVLGRVLRQAIRAPRSRAAAVSVPFPTSFATAIAYTRRDMQRNGASRFRVRSAGRTGSAKLKGLGRAGTARTSTLPLFQPQPL
jgi:DNA (cytosine-5)-methyltransferase 1